MASNSVHPEAALVSVVNAAIRRMTGSFGSADDRPLHLMGHGAEEYDDESAPLFTHEQKRAATEHKAAAMADVASTEDDEDLMEKPGKVPHKTTNCQTMMHLLKGNIGTGILAMPSAFANAGLLVGTLGLVFMGTICIHCMHILVTCNTILCNRLGYSTLDYSGVAEHSIAEGPSFLRKMSRFVKKMVNVFLMITQFGFCCVYFLFVAKSIQKVVSNISGKRELSVYIFLSALLPIMIVFNFVKSLRRLSYASLVANIFQAFGLCLIFFQLVQDLPHSSLRPLSQSLEKLPLYFGTAVYAFEGIGIVLPLQNEMETPQDFTGLTGVLQTGMTIVACLYTAMGFFGYLKYGDSGKEGSITFTLPPSALNEVIRLMFAISIFLSYALQLYVPFHIIWPTVRSRFNINDVPRWKRKTVEFLVKAILVTMTFALSAAIPHVDLFIALVGAVSSSCLALIFPPMIEISTYWGTEISRNKWILLVVKDVLIMLFGLLGFFTGTYASLTEIVKAFKGES